MIINMKRMGKAAFSLTMVFVLLAYSMGCQTGSGEKLPDEMNPRDNINENKDINAVVGAVDFEHELDDYAPKKNNYNFLQKIRKKDFFRPKKEIMM